MITFKASTPQEKWIKQNFTSKANLMREINITRPTIDKLCKDAELFFKYVPRLARAVGISPLKLTDEVFKLSK